MPVLYFPKVNPNLCMAKNAVRWRTVCVTEKTRDPIVARATLGEYVCMRMYVYNNIWAIYTATYIYIYVVYKDNVNT